MQNKTSPEVILVVESPLQKNLLRNGCSQALFSSPGVTGFSGSPRFAIRGRKAGAVTVARLSKGDCTGLRSAAPQGGKGLSVEQPPYGSPARATRLR